MENMKEVLDETYKSLKRISEEQPEFMGAFSGFMKAVEKDGALSGKTKELISIALSVSGKCHWCIAYHVSNALKLGATREEITEACQVAVLMGGGPALMYTQHVMKALDDLSK